MYRILALALVPLTLFLAACGGGSSDEASRQDSRNDPPASVSDNDSSDADGGLTLSNDGTYGDDGGPVDVVSDNDVPDDFALSDSSDDAGGFDLLGTVNPLQFLGGMDTVSVASQNVDPSLEAALLTTADVPGFQSFGDFSYAVPSPYGDIEMVARMFFDGDISTESFDTMVMSAAMSMPPEALAEMGDLEDLTGLTDEDLAQIDDLSGGFGTDFIDFGILDADGLGDGGVGIHIEMDFAALLEGFGPVQGDDTLPDGIAADMYMFFSGDVLYMTMVAWPTNVSPTADALGLAQLMDSRA